MLHRRFSVEVPAGEGNISNARPFLYKLDKGLKEGGYQLVDTKVLRDDQSNIMRFYDSCRELVSGVAHLTLKTDEVLQFDKSNTYHTAGISGIISVCEEKDLEGFKKIIKDAFSLEDLQLTNV